MKIQSARSLSLALTFGTELRIGRVGIKVGRDHSSQLGIPLVDLGRVVIRNGSYISAYFNEVDVHAINAT